MVEFCPDCDNMIRRIKHPDKITIGCPHCGYVLSEKPREIIEEDKRVAVHFKYKPLATGKIEECIKISNPKQSIVEGTMSYHVYICILENIWRENPEWTPPPRWRRSPVTRRFG